MTDTPPERPAGRWATREEAAEYMRVSPATIGRLGAAGRITRHVLSPTLTRYDLDEIDRLLISSATPTSGGGE